MDTSNINKQTKQGNEQVERRSTDRFGSKNTLSKNQNKQGTYKIEEENIEGRNIKRVQITESKIDNEIKNYSNDINPYNLSEIELIKDSVKEVADETRTSRNSKYSLEEPTNEQGKSDFDTESVVNTETSAAISRIPKEQQRRANNKSINKEVIGNSEENIDIKNTQELDNSSFSLDKLPKVKEGYTRLYRGLNNDYDVNYDRSTLDSPNGYDTLTDNYELANLQFVFLWYTYARGVSF